MYPSTDVDCDFGLSTSNVAMNAACGRASSNVGVFYYWIQNAIVPARKLNAGSPYWITLREMDHQKLRDWVHNSNRIHSSSLTHPEGGAL